MKVTPEGQVTIPSRIREKLGITSDSEVEFVERDNHVELVKVTDGDYRGRIAKLRGTWKGPPADELMKMTRGES